MEEKIVQFEGDYSAKKPLRMYAKVLNIVGFIFSALILAGGLIAFFVMLDDWDFEEIWYIPLVAIVVSFVNMFITSLFANLLWGFSELIEQKQETAKEREEAITDMSMPEI